VVHDAAEPAFSYRVETLRPGRFPFHRWRWELWDGALLLAAGWATTPPGAERALRRAVARRMHELSGVHPLRLDLARFLDPLRRGAATRVDTGVGVCLLVEAA
jgi:hypothetical protein